MSSERLSRGERFNRALVDVPTGITIATAIVKGLDAQEHKLTGIEKSNEARAAYTTGDTSRGNALLAEAQYYSQQADLAVATALVFSGFAFALQRYVRPHSRS